MTQNVPIEKQLLEFLQGVIDREKIDLIVCCERKATAILRALIKEIAPPNLSWEWHKIVSTNSMFQFDWFSFVGKKVLLFDEMVHHGNTLKLHKNELMDYLPKGVDVITAGFAVWNRCEHPPDFSYYRSIDLEAYEEIREDIVCMLQQNGSLLLDTEHIELRARIYCGVREFYNELAMSTNPGQTTSFISNCGVSNLTINDPDILDDSLKRLLPPRSKTEGVVRKCRVLERSHDTFSIVPIFYPNIPKDIPKEWIDTLPEFADSRNRIDANSKELFYIAGLLASIELLRGVVASLSYLIRENKITLEVPKENFDHLKAMFPKINTSALWEYVRNIVFESKLMKPRRRRGSVECRFVENNRLLNLCYRVITSLIEYYDNRDSSLEPSPSGRSWREMLSITREVNQDLDPNPLELTVVPDRLIDAGLLRTQVEEGKNKKGEVWSLRTFIPDEEAVSAKLRRTIMVMGTRWLPKPPIQSQMPEK